VLTRPLLIGSMVAALAASPLHAQPAAPCIDKALDKQWP